jgi:hypothetical protein
MQYTTMRDRQGKALVAPKVAGGVFVSDDDPAEAPEAAPAEGDSPPATPEPTAPRPTPRRTRSTLDRQLRGELPTAPANWQVLAGYAVIALLGALALYVLLGRAPAPAASEPAAPTDAPVVAAAPVAAAPAGVPLPLAAVAYDSPGGTAIDALEPGRRCVPVQRPDLDWVQLECDAAGLVWVRAKKLTGLEDQLPPIPTPAPTATPEPPPPPRPAPVYQAPVYVPPAPAPLECAEMIVDGQSYGQACASTRAELMATHQAIVETAP